MNKELTVNLFGGFSMSYGDIAISLERNTKTKVNQLLQILFLVGEEGIRREELVSRLFEKEELANSNNSLRAVVFRLRKLLEKTDLPKDTYVIVQQDVYSWTRKIPYTADVQLFDYYLEQAELETNAGEKTEWLMAAIKLYKGPLFDNLSSENWAISASNTYKEKYTEALEMVAEEYLARQQYANLLPYVSIAASMYPYENWQGFQMKCLYALGQSKEAEALYERTAFAYRQEEGMKTSALQSARKTAREDAKKNEIPSAKELQKITQPKENTGAYYCTYPNFLECYRYALRVLERTKTPAQLLLCSLEREEKKSLGIEKAAQNEMPQNRALQSDALQNEAMKNATLQSKTSQNEAMKNTTLQSKTSQNESIQNATNRLYLCIQKNLRKGDLFTRYSKTRYLIFLVGLRVEHCELITMRIRDAFCEKEQADRLTFQTLGVWETS